VEKSVTAFGLVIALVQGGSYAQDLKAAQACAHLSDDAARLACYDTALRVAKAPSAWSAGAQPVAAQPPVAEQADAQARFGDDGRLNPKSKPELPKALTAQVQEVASLPNGLYRLVLDNGQVWRTTEADDALAFKVNNRVTISRMVLGNYEISLAGHATSVSAKRIK
jgi:hypothetical protein